MADPDTEQLMQEGLDCIDRGEYDRALEIGHELCGRRFSGGFEVLAAAHLADGQPDEALRVLETGVDKAPTVWILWQMLGNCCSDMGHFERAQAAYHRALACPGGDPNSINLNRAIALHRQKRSDEAWELLQSLNTPDPSICIRVRVEQMSILNGQGRHDEAVRIGRLMLERLDDTSTPDLVSLLRSEIAESLRRSGYDSEVVMPLALEAARLDPQNDQALWLIRELEGECSPDASYFRLLLHGRIDLPERGGPLEFFSKADVVATSAHEALELVKRLEPDDIGETLTIDEYEVLEPRPVEPIGVYRLSAHFCFLPDSQE